jgi:hypothetical protein
MTTIPHLLVWSFIAFWLWIALTAALMSFRVPAPVVLAALLSWIAAGLFVSWAASYVG